MSNFNKFYRYSAELEELERIDNEKERQFRKLELLLKAFDKYEEVRIQFGIVTSTTTVTSATAPSAGISVNVTGASTSSLEARVAALETQNALIRAEFEAFKATQALKNQTFEALIKALQAASQAAGGAAGSMFQQ